jgi:hypothetical protein
VEVGFLPPKLSRVLLSMTKTSTVAVCDPAVAVKVALPGRPATLCPFGLTKITCELLETHLASNPWIEFPSESVGIAVKSIDCRD